MGGDPMTQLSSSAKRRCFAHFPEASESKPKTLPPVTQRPAGTWLLGIAIALNANL